MSVIYNKVDIPVSGSAASTWIAPYLASLSDCFSVGDNWGNYATILYNNKIRLYVSINYTNLWWINAARDYSSESAWSHVEWGWTGNLSMETIVSPDFMYLRFVRQSAPNTRGAVIACVRNTDRYYIGGSVLQDNNPSSIKDISAIPMNNIDTGVGGIYFRNALTFPCKPGMIAYIPNAIISDNNSVCVSVKDTLGCTNVAYDSRVSIGADNYYAIGTNTLVRLDEVVE